MQEQSSDATALEYWFLHQTVLHRAYTSLYAVWYYTQNNANVTIYPSHYS